jgi:hypothetical protein
MVHAEPGRPGHPPVVGQGGPEPTVPPTGEGVGRPAAWMVDAARGLLETGVGLGVLGVLRLRSQRPRLEAELERRGLIPLADLSRSTGNLLDQAVLRLLQPPAPAPEPRPGDGIAPRVDGSGGPGG